MICLDNDDAGLNAIERLCAGTYIWDFAKKKGVEITVGSLPDGVKDPGEFVEMHAKKNAENVRECFETKVLDNALLWSDWYIDRLIKNYNPDDSSSFASVCDDITTFLAKNPNAADRTKQAYQTAKKLATRITESDGKSSGSLQIQLESDLLSMASRKASKKEALDLRIEAIDRLAQNERKSGKQSKPQGMPGHTISESKKRQPSGIDKVHDSVPKYVQNSHHSQFTNESQIKTRSRKQYMHKTPHFSGFRFNPTDAAWLGIKNVSEWYINEKGK